MKWFLVLVSLACACTEPLDDRPMTLAYVAEAILAPNCGTATCHSTWKHAQGDVFDTVAGALHTFQQPIFAQPSYPASLLSCYGSDGVTLLDPCMTDDADQVNAYSTFLYHVLVDRDIDGGDRMPLDQPLATKNIEFIAAWIDAGAPGYTSTLVPAQ